MKKLLTLLMAVVLLLTFGLFALGSSESDSSADDQGSGAAAVDTAKTNLGDYNVEIKSCRLAKDYEGKDVVIVTYGFTNYGDDAASFSVSLEDAVYQSGVGLNKAYVLADSANYSADNQTKEIKKDASIDVEVAYELNDTTTPIDVEVSEWISFDDAKVTKTFTIA